MFTHGNAVGGGRFFRGLASNTLGFSATGSTASNGQCYDDAVHGDNDAARPLHLATGRASGPAFGTGYTTTTGYTARPPAPPTSTRIFGARAPEYLNWSFGFQHQWTSALTSTITYVGSQGHFLPADGSNARGYWANQLDPKYLSRNSSHLGCSTSAICAANACPRSPTSTPVSSST